MKYLSRVEYELSATRTSVWSIDPQLIALFWEVMEPLEDSVLVEEVSEEACG